MCLQWCLRGEIEGERSYLESCTNWRELWWFGGFIRWSWKQTCNEGTTWSTQECLMFSNDIIFVFVKKQLRLICDLKIQFKFMIHGFSKNQKVFILKRTYISSIMTNGEVRTSQLWLGETLVVLKCLIKLLCKCFMCWSRKHTAETQVVV